MSVHRPCKERRQTSSKEGIVAMLCKQEVDCAYMSWLLLTGHVQGVLVTSRAVRAEWSLQLQAAASQHCSTHRIAILCDVLCCVCSAGVLCCAVHCRSCSVSCGPTCSRRMMWACRCASLDTAWVRAGTTEQHTAPCAFAAQRQQAANIQPCLWCRLLADSTEQGGDVRFLGSASRRRQRCWLW